MINIPILLKQINYSKKFKTTDLKNHFVRCFSNESADTMFFVIILISFYALFHREETLQQIDDFLSKNPDIDNELKGKIFYFKKTALDFNSNVNMLHNNYNDLTYFNSVIDSNEIQTHLQRVLSSYHHLNTNCKTIELYYLYRNVRQEQRLARNLLRFIKAVKKDIHKQISYLQKVQ